MIEVLNKSKNEPVSPGETYTGKILIVEDEEINRFFLTKLLSLWGFTTKIAINGQEALNLLQNPENRFCAVLMDISMPVMDGLEATKYIRNTLGQKTLPIIATTAYVSQKNIDDCYQAGMDAFIAKPIPKDDLRETLTLLIKRTGR